MSEKEIILVTGPSGVHVRDSLKRLNKSISEKNIISVQKKIEDINDAMPFRELLGAPQYEQYHWWLKAFREILENDIPERADVEPLFLNFHAVYYHPKKQEFFSAIDIKTLKEIKGLRRIKMLIVLIDDVYDVYKRLMDEREMYEDVRKKEKTEPREAIFSSISNITTLLVWRKVEIAFSRFIARFLDIPMFVIPTKHPSFMINRLVEKPLNELKIYYLSHPITGIRRESQKHLPSFVGRLESIIQTIISDENTVLFLPTSIDELIIERKETSRGKYFYQPKLGQRWAPLGEEQLLFPPLPGHLETINPLNPQNASVSQGKGDPTGDPTAFAISQMLSSLWDFIYEKQIVPRDSSLVEQSKDGIIALRPFFKGEQSTGAMAEIKYNLQLMNKEKKRKCFILSCREDSNKFIIYKFFNTLVRNYLTKDSAEKFGGGLEGLRNSWLPKADEYTEQDSESIRKRIEEKLPKLNFNDSESSKSATRWSSSMTEGIEKRKGIFSKCWEDAKKDPIQTVIHGEIKTDEIKKDVHYEKSYNESSFWEKVNQFIKQRNKKEKEA